MGGGGLAVERRMGWGLWCAWYACSCCGRFCVCLLACACVCVRLLAWLAAPVEWRLRVTALATLAGDSAGTGTRVPAGTRELTRNWARNSPGTRFPGPRPGTGGTVSVPPWNSLLAAPRSSGAFHPARALAGGLEECRSQRVERGGRRAARETGRVIAGACALPTATPPSAATERGS